MIMVRVVMGGEIRRDGDYGDGCDGGQNDVVVVVVMVVPFPLTLYLHFSL